MVTPRSGSTFSNVQRTVFPKIIEKFGRDDITITRKTFTKDSNNNITAITTTTETISGDLQFVTYQDKQFLKEGIANVGDGIFYCIYSTTLSEGDKITVNSVDWEFTSLVEYESIDTDRIYQGWICARRV